MADVYVAESSVVPESGRKVVEEITQGLPEEVVQQILKRAGETRRSVLMGSYNVDTGPRFINEQKDEIVVMMVRAHPITNLGWILTVLFMLALASAAPLELMFPIPYKFIFVTRLVWYMVTMGYAFEKFLNWFYSVFIVTNERVVDIDFVNLLTRDVAYGTLNHIEEPSMVSGGFIQTLFKYGHIYIPTAAERSSLEAISVPYPDKVISIISELSEELEKRREKGE